MCHKSGQSRGPPLQSVKLPISDSEAYLGSHDFCKPLEGANVPPVVRGPHLDDPEPSRGKTRSATLRRGRGMHIHADVRRWRRATSRRPMLIQLHASCSPKSPCLHWNARLLFGQEPPAAVQGCQDATTSSSSSLFLLFFFGLAADLRSLCFAPLLYLIVNLLASEMCK